MPLRALLDTRDIYAPSVRRADWEALRRETRAGAADLTLPCCGTRAFQRTSPRGLQHFFHSPDSICDERGETVDHVTAKWAITRGCEMAGYEACSEWTGDDWRADVLAVRNTCRIAFEVQWSPQTLETTLERQARYADAGIRGCWFFRRPPPPLKSPYPEQAIRARQDLPAFLMRDTPQGHPVVYLNGRHYQLDDFVAALLQRRIHFSTHARLVRWQPVVLLFYDVQCWRCGRWCHVYCLDRRAYASGCGIESPLHRGPFDRSRPALRPEIQRAAWNVLLTDGGLALRLGSLEPRTINGRERMSFGCFHCDASFGDHALSRREDAVRTSNSWTAIHHTEVRMTGPYMRSRPHWCFPESGEYCTE